MIYFLKFYFYFVFNGLFFFENLFLFRIQGFISYSTHTLCVCVLLLQDLLQSCLSGTREEPGTLTQGAPVFPGVC
jgi:hypothetical protein